MAPGILPEALDDNVTGVENGLSKNNDSTGVPTLRKSITLNLEAKILEPRYVTESQRHELIPGRSFVVAKSNPLSNKPTLTTKSSILDIKEHFYRSRYRLMKSAEFLVLPTHNLLAKWIMLWVFSETGVFIFMRVFPFLNLLLTPMLVFCPGGGTFCGESGYGGTYYSAAYIGIMTLVLYGLCVVSICIQSQSYWVFAMDRFVNRKSTGRFFGLVSKWSGIEQEVIIAPVRTDMRIRENMGYTILYIVFAPMFVIASELVLLFRYPFHLSSVLFFTDYEIARSVLFGTTISLLNIVNASISIYANNFSVIGILALCSNGILPFIAFAFVYDFAGDDRISFLASWLNNCKIPPTQSAASDDEEAVQEDCPFYRTMKYRSRVDFRAEKALLKFQISQLVNNLRINWKLTELKFDYSNLVSVESSEILAQFIRRSLNNGLFLERINRLELHQLAKMDCFIATPDERRVAVLWSSKQEEDLVPWNDKIRFNVHEPTGPEFILFPLTTTVAFCLLEPARLLELDIGSNKLGDEVVENLRRLLEEATNLVLLEMGSNQFTVVGVRALLPVISNHASLKFLRVSTVLLRVQELKTEPAVDLSLPKLFSDAIERCVESLFVCACEQGDLRGDFFGKPNQNYDKFDLTHYMRRLKSILGDEYRLVGRDVLRSLPQGLVDLCVQRTAHRLGKLLIPDPGEELDLPKEKIGDGNGLDDKVLQETKLFPFILSAFDVEVIARLLKDHNSELVDFDMRGMPLLNPLLIMKAIRGKRQLRSLNLSFCQISESEAVTILLDILRDDNAAMRELYLRGNLAFEGKRPEIWDVIGAPQRKSHPRVVIDVNNALTGSLAAILAGHTKL